MEDFFSPSSYNNDEARKKSLSYKAILNEYCQKNHIRSHPKYFLNEHTEYLSPLFSSYVMLDGHTFIAENKQKSKKGAEQEAARIACEALGLCEKRLDSDKIPDTVVVDEPGQGALWDDEELGDGDDDANGDVTVCDDDDDMVIKTYEPQIAPMYFDFEQDDIEDHECLRSSETTVKEPEKEIEIVKAEPKERKMVTSIVEEVTGKTYKCLLNEFAQKNSFEPPIYKTEVVMVSNYSYDYYGEVTFCGKVYRSPEVASNKKSAQHSAAKACLVALEMEKEKVKDIAYKTKFDSIKNENSNIVTTIEEDLPDPSSSNFKNLLDEHLMQRGLQPASYEAVVSEGMFTATCTVEGRKALNQLPKKRKKDAEQEAAKQALIQIGISDPDKVLMIRDGLITKKSRRSSSKSGGNDSFSNEFSSEDPDIFDFDRVARKSEMEEREKKLITDDKFEVIDDPLDIWYDGEPTIFGTSVSKILDLSVTEDWPEKRNIIVVGNREFSIPLKCIGSTKEVICHKEQKRVRLRPGANIRGLACEFHLKGNQIYLHGKSCEEIVYPKKPLPVLLSCGIVFIQNNPNESDSPQVLLKRYVTSPAFVHVSASIAQWFRRFVSGRPMKLDIEATVKHVKFWLDSEVSLMAEMTEESLRELFSHTWKFKDSWATILRPFLPEDLMHLKKRCDWELQRRYVSGQKSMKESRKPWSPPKGNFKHRLLVTGIFLEDGPECAFRELKEETGISVSLRKLASCPYVDIENLEYENFNPHKGDFVRYYLYHNEVVDRNRGNKHVADICTEKEQRGIKRKHDDSEDNDSNEKRTKVDTNDGDGQEGESELEEGEITDDEDDDKHGADGGADVLKVEEETSWEVPMQATVHEECIWLPLKKAVESSPVFRRIHETKKFKAWIASRQMSR